MTLKVLFFLTRIIISMVVIIISKSLFICWYECTLSWDGFCNNFFSLYSGLMGIGVLAAGLINKFLDFTPLNITIKNFLPDHSLKRLKNFLADHSLKRLKNLILSWNEGRVLVLNQDRNSEQGVAGQPGGTSSSGSQVQPNDIDRSPRYRPIRSANELQAKPENNTPEGSSINTPDGSSIKDWLARHRNRPNRSPFELEKARHETALRNPQRPDESDEDYTNRIKSKEHDEYVRGKNKAKPILDVNRNRNPRRTSEMIEEARKAKREELTQLPGESDKAFTKRVNDVEMKSYRNRNRHFSSKGVGGSRKFSTLSNSTKHYFSGYGVKMRISDYSPTSNPLHKLVGDKDFGKTGFKSYSTYSRNLTDDGASSKLNNNIFLKRAIYNFIKASIHNLIPGVHIQDSTALITFLKEFDPDFKMSRQSVHNYRKRNLVFKRFIINPDVSRFFAYVNSRFPEFNLSAFLEKCSGTCMPASA